MEKTANEFGLKMEQMQEIAEAPFRFTAQVMSDGNRKLLDFKSVRIMYWGKFLVKEGRKKLFQKINDRS